MTVEKLLPFDEASRCPKCNYDDIWTRYSADPWRCPYASPCKGLAKVDEEHIDRGCRRCSFSWTEGTMAVHSAPSTACKCGAITARNGFSYYICGRDEDGEYHSQWACRDGFRLLFGEGPLTGTPSTLPDGSPNPLADRASTPDQMQENITRAKGVLSAHGKTAEACGSSMTDRNDEHRLFECEREKGHDGAHVAGDAMWSAPDCTWEVDESGTDTRTTAEALRDVARATAKSLAPDDDATPSRRASAVVLDCLRACLGPMRSADAEYLAENIIEGLAQNGFFMPPVGSATDELDRIRRGILESEAFMWLMVGANHEDAHLAMLRPAWKRYVELGGQTWGKASAHGTTAHGLDSIDPRIWADAMARQLASDDGASNDEGDYVSGQDYSQ